MSDFLKLEALKKKGLFLDLFTAFDIFACITSENNDILLMKVQRRTARKYCCFLRFCRILIRIHNFSTFDPLTNFISYIYKFRPEYSVRVFYMRVSRLNRMIWFCWKGAEELKGNGASQERLCVPRCQSCGSGRDSVCEKARIRF